MKPYFFPSNLFLGRLAVFSVVLFLFFLTIARMQDDEVSQPLNPLILINDTTGISEFELPDEDLKISISENRITGGVGVDSLDIDRIVCISISGDTIFTKTASGKVYTAIIER